MWLFRFCLAPKVSIVFCQRTDIWKFYGEMQVRISKNGEIYNVLLIKFFVLRTKSGKISYKLILRG